MKPEKIESFWSKVNICDDDSCWEWGASRYPGGYGRFSIKHKMVATHRLAYMIVHGNIPPGMCVLHRCDNPACVNPGHLFLGTQKDNMRDMNSKGRSGKAKLKKCEVLEIRRLYATGKFTHELLGKMFRISTNHIGNILIGRRWVSVE